MWRAACLVSLLACAADEPDPLLPPPTLELPAQLLAGFDNIHNPLQATDSRLFVQIEGGHVELDAQGASATPLLPGTAYKIHASRQWVAAVEPGPPTSIVRITPAGAVETSPFSKFIASLAAGPDGVFWHTGTGEVWSWTSGAPVQLSWKLPTTFTLISADAAYLYGDEKGPIVRYARTTGAREEVVARGEYDSSSLVLFEHRGDTIMYSVGSTLMQIATSNGLTSKVGSIPDEVYATIAFDGSRTFYGAYRYQDGVRERLLGAPRDTLAAFSQLIGDLVVWVTVPPYGDQGTSTLYTIDASAELP